MDVNNLIQQLTQRAGISEDQAQKAVGVFLEFAKNNLSDDQIQGFMQQVPGLNKYADQIPGGLGDKLGDALGGFGNRGS